MKKVQNEVEPKTPALRVGAVGDSAAPKLKECMMGRDGECWHRDCPVTMEDAERGIFCELPLHDYRE